MGTILGKTVAHFWPEFRPWLDDLRETRDPDRIIYASRFLTWLSLMIFLLKLGSRRQLNFELDSPVALKNLNRLSGCAQEKIAHHDTLNHFLGHVHPAEFAALRRKMVFRLVRMKVLDAGRLMGHFLVVLDGTGQLQFRERHCPHCLEETVKGTTYYYHNVLEAKLVTPEGLAISVGTEFIENADPNASKQDCELKAFYRLAQRLKKDFPQLRLCLLLDALYANGPVVDICRQNHWKYIIVFKEGSLPAVWQEYQALRDLCPRNVKVHKPRQGCEQTYRWVDELPFVDSEGRKHSLRAFECREINGLQKHFFAWITNFSIRAENAAALANRGGRCRWKIENEGFNIQKNGGFNLEHAYSIGDRENKGFYLLMQIAHMILQLIERGSLLGQCCKKLFGSLRNLAKRLAESLRFCQLADDAVDPATAGRIQIRLDGW